MFCWINYKPSQKCIPLYKSQFILHLSAMWMSASTPCTEQPQIHLYSSEAVWHSSSLATFGRIKMHFRNEPLSVDSVCMHIYEWCSFVHIICSSLFSWMNPWNFWSYIEEIWLFMHFINGSSLLCTVMKTKWWHIVTVVHTLLPKIHWQKS